MQSPRYILQPMERAVSIIVPTYKEVLNVEILVQQLFQVCQQAGIKHEIIFVDDNSNDGIIDVVKKLLTQDPKTHVITENAHLLDQELGTNTGGGAESGGDVDTTTLFTGDSITTTTQSAEKPPHTSPKHTDVSAGTTNNTTLGHADNVFYNVKLIIRTNERGLSSAVLRGFEEAQYDTLLVMDADLQHQPKYVPTLLQPIFTGLADFSIGSRHTAGGGIEGWALHRKIISWGATFIARPLVPTCTDPMSGFFALTKNTLSRAKILNPLGYKIGLELAVRCKPRNIIEVPIIFRDRALGESKLSLKTHMYYLLHVTQLYVDTKQHYTFIVLLLIAIFIMFCVKRRFLPPHDVGAVSSEIGGVKNQTGATTDGLTTSGNVFQIEQNIALATPGLQNEPSQKQHHQQQQQQRQNGGVKNKMD